jgi:uncharacterized protein YjiS (DUF1127 family)
MTTNSALSRSHGIVTTGRLSYLGENLAARFREWQRRSRSRRDLMMLNDRELWDVRLSRVDARREARKPFWQE